MNLIKLRVKMVIKEGQQVTGLRYEYIWEIADFSHCQDTFSLTFPFSFRFEKVM